MAGVGVRKCFSCTLGWCGASQVARMVRRRVYAVVKGTYVHRYRCMYVRMYIGTDVHTYVHT